MDVAAHAGIVVESTTPRRRGPQTPHSCIRYWIIAIPRSPTVILVIESSSTTSSAASAANARRHTWSGDFRSSWDKTKRGSSGHRIQRPSIVAVVHTDAGALLEWDAERRETGSREDAGIVVGAVDDEAQQLLVFLSVSKRITTWTLDDGST